MDEFKQKVYQSASDGKDGLLDTLLKHRSNVEMNIALNCKAKSGEEELTPLLIAAKNCHVKVVKLLLQSYLVYPDQTGTVSFENQTIRCATALWISGYTGNVEIAEMLLAQGANINHTTSSLSVPMRPAVYCNHLDIVKLFVEYCADVNLGNKHGHTLLMNLDGKKDNVLLLAKVLLQAGANPNGKKEFDGRRVLHECVLNGNVKLVQEFLNHGAVIHIADDNGVTPIEMACDEKKEDIVKCLTAHSSITKEQKLNALELLGSNLVFDNIDKAYNYFHTAMKERELYGIMKKILSPVDAYENRHECTNLLELAKLKGNKHFLVIESLLVKERVLGAFHHYLPYDIKYYAAVLTDEGEVSKALPYALRAIDKDQNVKADSSLSLQLATAIMAGILHKRGELNAKNVLQTFSKCSYELQRCIIKDIGESTKKSTNTATAIWLVGLFLETKASSDESDEFLALVKSFIHLSNTSGDPSTPLHYACKEETYTSEEYISEVLQFPNKKVVQVLLQCGAQPNLQDKDGNTALHVIVQYAKVTGDVSALKEIVAMFIDAKANVEIRNKQGDNALQVAGKKINKAIENDQLTPGLKKMVQQIVKKR